MQLVGPRGDVGPAGPAGESGSDGTVTEAHLQMVIANVVASLKSDPSLRGPTGQAGPAGPTGEAGPGITPAQIAALKAELLAEIKHPDIRVVIGDGKKIIDDETYKAGEPIVLDFAAIIKAANAK